MRSGAMTPSRSPTRSRSSCPISGESWKPVASLVSSTQSAAQATYSAYKRQPIRWRLAGGSAALTLVILLGFAVIVGTLTTRAINKDFNRQVASAADRLQNQLYYQYDKLDKYGHPQYKYGVALDAYAASNNAAIRVVTGTGRRFASSSHAPSFGAPRAESEGVDGWRVETREIQVISTVPQYDIRVFAQYARRISDVRATANRVKLFLGFGV